MNEITRLLHASREGDNAASDADRLLDLGQRQSDSSKIDPQDGANLLKVF